MIERILELERRCMLDESRLIQALSRITALEQASAQQWGGGGGGSSSINTNIGVATTAIAARSGNSVSSGTIEIYSQGGGALTDAGYSVTAFCATSRTTAAGNGVDVGNYVWVESDSTGTIWCSPLDCT